MPLLKMSSDRIEWRNCNPQEVVGQADLGRANDVDEAPNWIRTEDGMTDLIQNGKVELVVDDRDDKGKVSTLKADLILWRLR
jgi:hypothetical protein